MGVVLEIPLKITFRVYFSTCNAGSYLRGCPNFCTNFLCLFARANIAFCSCSGYLASTVISNELSLGKLSNRFRQSCKEPLCQSVQVLIQDKCNWQWQECSAALQEY